jgi:RNA polymerase nonessential primary-like sigma factor
MVSVQATDRYRYSLKRMLHVAEQEKSKVGKIVSSRSSTNTLDTYLKEITRVPLLKPDEEVFYGRRVQQMMQLLYLKTQLVANLGHTFTQTAWAHAAQLTESQLQEILNQGQWAKRKMIEANLRLVVAVAKHYQKRNVELLDLIQEGYFGLQRSVERFDPSQGNRFSTYAYWWIWQAITQAIATQSRTIRLPVRVSEEVRRIKKMQAELSYQLGRTPRVPELAQALNLEPKKVYEYLQLTRRPISLEYRCGDNQDTELHDLLGTQESSPEAYLVREELSQQVRELLAALPARQQQVLSLRYGLVDGHSLTLQQIGQRLQISRERVRQIEFQALNCLRLRHKSLHSHLMD